MPLLTYSEKSKQRLKVDISLYQNIPRPLPSFPLLNQFPMPRAHLGRGQPSEKMLFMRKITKHDGLQVRYLHNAYDLEGGVAASAAGISGTLNITFGLLPLKFTSLLLLRCDQHSHSFSPSALLDRKLSLDNQIKIYSTYYAQKPKSKHVYKQIQNYTFKREIPGIFFDYFQSFQTLLPTIFLK